MSDRPLLVSAPALKAFIVSVFERWGTPPAIAELTADLMVRTDLRGVDSHGVGMLPTYQRWYRRGWIVPTAEPKIVRDETTTAVLDGQQAFGHYTATLAMELALAKARAHGVGFVTCRNSNHYGAAANYSMMALRAGHGRHQPDQLRAGRRPDLRAPGHARDESDLRGGARRRRVPLRARHGDQHRRDRQAVGRAPLGETHTAGVGPRPEGNPPRTRASPTRHAT